MHNNTSVHLHKSNWTHRGIGELAFLHSATWRHAFIYLKEGEKLRYRIEPAMTFNLLLACETASRVTVDKGANFKVKS
jgi:hypothetical protein